LKENDTIRNILWRESSAIGERKDAIDADKPVLGSEGLLDVFQVEVFVADFRVPHSIITRRFPGFSVEGAEAVVAALVHETSEHGRGSLLIDSELAGFGVVIGFFNVGIRAPCDSYHPQKFVDIVRSIANQASEYHQNVVHVHLSHDLIAIALRRRERLANLGDVTVIPGIVVNEDGSICHCRYLVAIIPP